MNDIKLPSKHTKLTEIEYFDGCGDDGPLSNAMMISAGVTFVAPVITYGAVRTAGAIYHHLGRIESRKSLSVSPKEEMYFDKSFSCRSAALPAALTVAGIGAIVTIALGLAGLHKAKE